jgi:hypothetical protein
MQVIRGLPLAVGGLAALAIPSAVAAGECRTSGSLALAGMPESTLSLDLSYHYGWMETSRAGTTSVGRVFWRLPATGTFFA